MTPALINSRVSRGAGFLDAVCPGWAGLINLDRFDMGSTNSNLCQQLYGELAGLRLDWQRQVAFGFQPACVDGDLPVKFFGLQALRSMRREDDQLTDAWLEQIQIRLGVRAVAS